MPPERDEGAEGQVDQKPVKAVQDGAEGQQVGSQQGGGDAFAKAFAKAEAEVKGEKPAEAKKAKPKAKDEGDEAEDKPAPKKKADADAKAKAEEKPAPKKAKAEDADDDGDDDPDDDGPAPNAPKKPAEPRRSWSSRRREDFRYLTPEEQERWLSEPLEPETSWDESTKAAFKKMPVEAQEELIVKSRSLEAGYNKKFMEVAAERKKWDDATASLPASVRRVMEQRGADAPTALKTLAAVQEFASRDPVGYIADFIKRGNVDVNAIADRLGEAGQQPAAQQADIRSHPEFRALADQVGQLKGMLQQFQGQAAAAEKEAEAEVSKAFENALNQRDEGGALRYPFIRVLSDYMADLIEGDPETFRGMPPTERLDLAYRTALAQHPELRAVQTAKKPSKATPSEASDDEDDADAAQPDRREKLKAAQTRKSNTPHSAPGKSGDPFRAAFDKAEKSLRR